MCNSYDLQFVISLCSSCTEWQLRHNWVDIRNMVTNSIGELSKVSQRLLHLFQCKSLPQPKTMYRHIFNPSSYMWVDCTASPVCDFCLELVMNKRTGSLLLDFVDIMCGFLR